MKATLKATERNMDMKPGTKPSKGRSAFKICWGNDGAYLAGVVYQIWFNLRHRPQEGVHAQYCQEMETRLPKDVKENQSKLEKGGMETG